jgi:hypothetical protein
LAKSLHGAKLQLLDGAFAASEVARNVADTSLLNKPAEDDTALVVWEQGYELREQGVAFRCIRVRCEFDISRWSLQLAIRALPPLGDKVGGDAEQPRDKRRALPLKSVEAGHGLMEDFGSEVFGFLARRDTASDKGVNAIEVSLVKRGEVNWVSLRGLNQVALFAGRFRGVDHAQGSLRGAFLSC